MRGYIIYCALIILIIGCTLPFTQNIPELNKKIVNIAHRGASGYAPENTFAAFDKAVQMKVDYIELDIQMSKDQKLVVIHDAKVDRTTNGTGFIRDLTLQQLKQLDAGSWFDKKFKDERIPTLKEVIEEYGNKVGLLIELKNPSLYPGIEKKFIEVLSPYMLLESPLDIKVQSFELETIKTIRNYFPMIAAGVILNRFVSYRELLTISKSADFINIKKHYISGHLVMQAHQLGLMIYAWTVNDISNLKFLLDIGIDGAIVDYPELIHTLYPAPH